MAFLFIYMINYALIKREERIISLSIHVVICADLFIVIQSV